MRDRYNITLVKPRRHLSHLKIFLREEKIVVVFKKFISDASLFKNLPFPLFAKEGFISSLWQREVRRDFVIDVFMFVTLLVLTLFRFQNSINS
jgi:hypothetical protein